MKRYLLIILYTFPLFSFAQSDKRFFEGGLIVGFNAAQVDGDKLYGFHKIGANLGVMGGFPIYKKSLYFQFELLYSQKGSRMSNSQINSQLDPNSNYFLTLNYAEIPLMLSYHDKDSKTRISGGVSIGSLFSGTEKINNAYSVNAVDFYKKRDICWLADISYMASKHVGVGMRYSYSLLYIRNFANYTYNGLSLVNPYFGTNQFNNYISIRGIYLF